MVNEYNHGMPKDDEGYGMDEYDMPPEPPPPEPIIPTALYYELPAGLMAPLVGVRNMHHLQSQGFFFLVVVKFFLSPFLHFSSL